MQQDTSSRVPARSPRIVVLENTGSGKTSTARQIAQVLDVPFVELDALHWEANWTPTDEGVFRGRVQAVTAGDRWVVDGNYSVVRDIVWPRATAIAWLDYPCCCRCGACYAGRSVARCAGRGTELWSGNRESLWRHFATRESLLLWAVTSHQGRRARIVEALAKPEHAHLTLHRFRKASQAQEWLMDLRASEVHSPRGPSR